MSLSMSPLFCCLCAGVPLVYALRSILWNIIGMGILFKFGWTDAPEGMTLFEAWRDYRRRKAQEVGLEPTITSDPIPLANDSNYGAASSGQLDKLSLSRSLDIESASTTGIRNEDETL